MEAHTEDVPARNTVTRTGVSNELIAIVAVGVMLAGLAFTTASWSRDDIRSVRDDVRILRDDVQGLRGNMGTLRGDFDLLRGEFDSLRGEFYLLRGEFDLLRGEVRTVQSGLSDLRERVVRIETLLLERSDIGSGH